MDDLNDLIADIQRFEAIISQWDESQRCVAVGLKSAIEALHKAALTNLIKSLKQDHISALRHAVDDEIIYAVLLYHNLVKPPLSEKIKVALAEIRPSLQSHNGDVELVAIKLPDTVEIKLLGSCSNCASSTLTLTQIVEQSIKKYCPEIVNIVAVNSVNNSPDNNTNDYVWVTAAKLEDLKENSILAVRVNNNLINNNSINNLILYKQGDLIICYRNACSHLGFPLDKGQVENGIITCVSHQFQYDLKTGKCLTVPDVSLKIYPVKVKHNRVYVQLVNYQ
ncbi:NifU family protein [Anabaena sp. FACHB-1237]|uniref:NifU family protein n=1 Tax=Anabaena sp. FACHB-1237 TaxID=2692769 RepID=UPI0016812B2B|nr:NifU family protein [Anabaena sp. FACHB-1237]MBD2138987.1 NifU family protein [Anabaena sp. FACHB-1237]